MLDAKKRCSKRGESNAGHGNFNGLEIAAFPLFHRFCKVMDDN